MQGDSLCLAGNVLNELLPRGTLVKVVERILLILI